MTVQAASLVFPAGKIQQNFFPGESLTALIDVWITEGANKASAADVPAELLDEATRDWVYYRAFSTVADRMASEPDQAASDGTSRTLSQDRIGYFRQQASSHLAQFNAAAQTGLSVRRSGTGGITNKVIF